MRGAALAAFALAAAGPPLSAQSSQDTVVVIVRDAGAGESGRMLRAALAAPRRLLLANDSAITLSRDSSYATSVIVLGGSATVDGTVRGDVIVVGGDLFVHPGARIEGRAVAVGGGVYPSILATVVGRTVSFRDNTFDVARTGDEIALDYRALSGYRVPLVWLPLGFGVRPTAYDRVEGLALAWGPVLAPDSGRFEIAPTVTYRSHLGALDPGAVVRWRPDRRSDLVLTAGRHTLTNDDWIRSDLQNALMAVAVGRDVRNYYRADAAVLEVSRRWETATSELEPLVGVMTERAWSVGPDSFAVRAPWSAFERRSREGMLRFNPPISRGRISSALVGLRARREVRGVVATSALRAELPFDAPDDRRFAQASLDAAIAFPTFGTQSYAFAAHGVATAGDSAPPQRFAYLGGSGTVPTLDLLELGGDQLFYVESNYNIPLDRVAIPYLGVPTLTLRQVVGGAGVRRISPLTQNLCLRLAVSAVRGELALDPAARHLVASLALSMMR